MGARGWRCGRSFLQPVTHRVVEAFGVRSADETVFVVRERSPDRPHVSRAQSRRIASGAAAVERTLREMSAWPRDFLLFRFARNSAQPKVEITAGSVGTVPVYFTTAGGVLWGDWDPVELYRHLGDEPLDLGRASVFLSSLEMPYSRATLFNGISQLTERATARWSRGRFTIDYPRPVTMPAVRAAGSDAEVLSSFQHVLQEATRQVIDGCRVVCAELSGGIDSGLVAATASQLRDTVHTFGLIMPGQPGRGQRRRRRALAARFGFRDTSFPVIRHASLTPPSSRVDELRVVPWEDCYEEAFERLVTRVRQAGGDVLLTGSGGDELLYLQTRDLPPPRHAKPTPLPPPSAVLTRRAREAYREALRSADTAPYSAVPSSVFEASATVAPGMVRQGVWPAHPLGNAAVYRYCQSLPVEWRRDRTLARRHLQALGCPRAVYRPRATENFGPVMEHALRRSARQVFTRLFAEPRLADLGLVDATRLRRAYERHCATPETNGDLPMDLYAAAVLELSVRAVDRARASARADSATARTARR